MTPNALMTTATASAATADPRLKVIEGIDLSIGRVNTPDDVLLEHVRYAIRQGHPQLRMQPVTHDRVAIVGGGPSLTATLPELVELMHEGARIVTVNGAYSWCLEHHLHPGTQVVLDARESNARFLDPPIPRCNYLLSSTCHPSVWERVRGRENVWMFHPFSRASVAGGLLEDYYLGQWQPVLAGTTVTTRALVALRLMGYLRFDLFGIDSCWLNGQHHAFDQPENAGERQYRVRVHPSGREDLARDFLCAPWHLKQIEDFLQINRVQGDQWALAVHGDGLLAHILHTDASISVEEG